MITTALRRVLPDRSWSPSPLEWLDEEELFDVLANDRRRQAVILLSERGRMHLDELAVTIAADEYDTHPDQLSAGERKCVRNALYQTHLPRLERYSLITFDGRNVATPIRGIEDVAYYAELGEDLAGGEG